MMENLRKHRDIKVVTTGKKENYLVSERSYHTTKCFTKNSLAKEMKETHTNTNRHTYRHAYLQILMNKSVYLSLAILELRKIVMYGFRYNYVKPK